mgnify:CR=1 FL=1
MKKIFIISLIAIFAVACNSNRYDEVVTDTMAGYMEDEQETMAEDVAEATACETEFNSRENSSSSSSYNSDDAPSWLDGVYVYETIDPTMYQIIVEAYTFSGGTYYFSRAQGDDLYSKGDRIRYTVRGNQIYNEKGEAIFRIDNSSKSLYHIKNDQSYQKQY